jgi:hypothetical protein
MIGDKPMISKLIEKEFNEYIQDIIDNHISYKMEEGNFEKWLSYLNSHPAKATYQGFLEYKDKLKEIN